MIRVFPRRTKWTPTDELAFVGDLPLPGLHPEDRNIPVLISCVFTWDKPEAERLYFSWNRYYHHVSLGGPAYGDCGGDFVAGRFIKEGVTITSRGCPRKCPWCVVPSREGRIRELPIVPGWIVQDNNLLACSEKHLDAVFKMLREQKRGIVFSGGLDARLFTESTIERLKSIRIKELWFACDDENAIPALRRVAELCEGISIEKKRCYVMIGHAYESLPDARHRLETVYCLGFLPFAQLYRRELETNYPSEWKALARKWSRPAAYRKDQ
jgi:hypothetical protein